MLARFLKTQPRTYRSFVTLTGVHLKTQPPTTPLMCNFQENYKLTALTLQTLLDESHTSNANNTPQETSTQTLGVGNVDSRLHFSPLSVVTYTASQKRNYTYIPSSVNYESGASPSYRNDDVADTFGSFSKMIRGRKLCDDTEDVSDSIGWIGDAEIAGVLHVDGDLGPVYRVGDEN
ncbi:hypothetical protein BKA69DRAFT_1040938 [Paraphysoderma sedebokerense]|nr:hypothetical protein BKA69DRAFT_1040938 [Paraphysoderma sedebokerense]